MLSLSFLQELRYLSSSLSSPSPRPWPVVRPLKSVPLMANAVPDLRLPSQQQNVTTHSRYQNIQDRSTRVWATCPWSLRSRALTGVEAHDSKPDCATRHPVWTARADRFLFGCSCRLKTTVAMYGIKWSCKDGGVPSVNCRSEVRPVDGVDVDVDKPRQTTTSRFAVSRRTAVVVRRQSRLHVGGICSPYSWRSAVGPDRRSRQEATRDGVTVAAGRSQSRRRSRRGLAARSVGEASADGRRTCCVVVTLSVRGSGSRRGDGYARRASHVRRRRRRQLAAAQRPRGSVACPASPAPRRLSPGARRRRPAPRRRRRSCPGHTACLVDGFPRITKRARLANVRRTSPTVVDDDQRRSETVQRTTRSWRHRGG